MNQTPYQIMGEERIRELSDAFYEVMDSAPEAAHIRAMHSKDLNGIKQKLAEFLIGWMGGPSLYAEKYGSVCMTSPHKAYAIGHQEKEQWLWCMDQALDNIGADDSLKQMLAGPLRTIAEMVQNHNT